MNEDSLIAVETRQWHLEEIAENMREIDVLECAAYGVEGLQALKGSLQNSSYHLTIAVDNEPAGVFGYSQAEDELAMSVVWMLGTEDLFKYPVALCRKAKAYINSLDDIVMNYVYVNNFKAIRFLKFLGASFSEETTDIGGLQFYHFTIGGANVS